MFSDWCEFNIDLPILNHWPALDASLVIVAPETAKILETLRQPKKLKLSASTILALINFFAIVQGCIPEVESMIFDITSLMYRREKDGVFFDT